MKSLVRRVRDDRLCWAVLVLAIVTYVTLDLYLTRATTLFVDEINVFSVDRGLLPSALFTPLNGHLVFTERLFYALNFKVFGAEWVPVRIGQALGASAAVACAFELARRRIGGAAALPLAVLLLFLGSAWELNFVPSGMGNVFAVAAALGALLALDRIDRRGDVFACALLVVAVTSFTLGVAFAAGALVLVLLQPRGRRRAWIALVPLVLWVTWLAWVRLEFLPDNPGAQTLRLSNLLTAPAFFASEAASLAGAVAGLDYPFVDRDAFYVFSTRSSWGSVVAALFLAALLVRLRRPATPLLWGALAALGVFWFQLAMGYGPGRDPTVVRYVYGGAVLTLVIAAEAARPRRFGDRALIALYVLVGCSLLTNVARLRDGMDVFRTASLSLRANLAGLEVARDSVPPDYVVNQPLQVVPAGAYLAAVDRIGSPAFSQDELLRRPEVLRAVADASMVRAERLGLAPSLRGARVGACTTVTAARASVAFPAAPRGVRVAAPSPVKVALRRFASSSPTPVGTAPRSRAVDLALPVDRSTRRWVVTFTPAPAQLRICALR